LRELPSGQTHGDSESRHRGGPTYNPPMTFLTAARTWAIGKLRPKLDDFLASCRGVIHVGANLGQEREAYARHGLHVIWLEPIPAIFSRLRQNLASFPLQRAYEYLLTDEDHKAYVFKIANNDGASSSILDFGLHRDIWPEVRYVDSIDLTSHTFKSFVLREDIDLANYDALVLDTQGSELLVLKGAAELLDRFKWIKTEVPDFESYLGCCVVADLEAYLGAHGFREWRRSKFAERQGGGSYYDIVYRRVA
jgi:FkbM family methyltransferase